MTFPALSGVYATPSASQSISQNCVMTSEQTIQLFSTFYESFSYSRLSSWQWLHQRKGTPLQVDKPHKMFVICSAAAYKGLKHNLKHLQLLIIEKSNKSVGSVWNVWFSNYCRSQTNTTCASCETLQGKQLSSPWNTNASKGQECSSYPQWTGPGSLPSGLPAWAMQLILAKAAPWRSSFHCVLKPTSHIPGTRTGQERKNHKTQSATPRPTLFSVTRFLFRFLPLKSLINSCLLCIFVL